MKKGDYIIIAVAIASVILSGILAFSLFGSAATSVTVSQNNKVVYSGNINTDNEITLGTNTIVINSGAVYMKDATCKNQICVNHKKISKKGESITCLPNKVLVEVE
ncbi:MAG: NusG domain II-containing protein [Clostridia bacterium]|nr:NusG domain II-containing protein [Clostridia bacterium]